MRNDAPQPIRCAVCDVTGPQIIFRRPGASDMNWVETRGGTYVVCNAHVDSVYLIEEDGFYGQPWGVTFYS